MKHSSKILACLASGLLFATHPAFAAKRLNNLVSELARVEFDAGEAAVARRVSFEMEKDGWIYIAARGKIVPGAEISMTLDGGDATPLVIGEMMLPEKMVYVPKGSHSLEIRTDEATLLEGVVIRAVPQIVFFAIDHHMRSRHRLDYSMIRTYRSLWDQGVLQNFNVATFDPANHTSVYEKEIREWRSMGRSAITKTSLPKDGKEEMEAIESLWVKPMLDPLTDGTIVDEITPKFKEILPYWGKVIKELGSRPELKGKKLYTFNSIGFPEIYMPLAEGLMASDYYFCPEVYLRRMGDLKGVTTKMKAWREAKPGIEKQMIIFLGPDNMAPGMSFHMHPQENYKTFLEKQIHLLATEPAFSDLGGVGLWSAHYMDDDILRCFARLARHYLIEGRTEPLFTDPLTLPHLKSPGFEEGLNGWKVEAASNDSVAVKSTGIVPFKQSPYSALPEGKKVLYTKRSKGMPNVISQTIRNLEPGRVYHLNVYALDLNHFQKAEAISASVELKGVELLDPQTKDSVIQTKALPKEEKAAVEDAFVYEVVKGKVAVTWNRYHRMFRATGETAELIISDWNEREAPAGPEGQELIWDFIELAPDISMEPVLPTNAPQF